MSKRLAISKCFSKWSSSVTPGPEQPSFKSAEIVVRSNSGWKALSKFHGSGGQDKINEVRKIISACYVDIVSLWKNEAVQSTILDHVEFQEHTTTL